MTSGDFEKGNFLSNYILERGLLNVSKSEYEKIVFYELVFIKNVCSFSVFNKFFDNENAKKLDTRTFIISLLKLVSV